MSMSHAHVAGNIKYMKYIYRTESDNILNYLLFADFHPEQVFHHFVDKRVKSGLVVT